MKFIKTQYLITAAVIGVGLLSIFATVSIFKDTIFSEDIEIDVIEDEEEEDKETEENDDNDDDDKTTSTSGVVISSPIDITKDNIVLTMTPYILSSLEEREGNILRSGSSFVNSRGVLYTSKDASQFEVYSILDGEVTSVNTLNNLSDVTIKYENDIVVTYYELSDVTLVEGDNVSQDDKIGDSSQSTREINYPQSVYIVVYKKDTLLNLAEIIGIDPSEIED